MAITIKRTATEIKRILRGYEESGLTRREYCSQIGIPVTTLDYYRNRSNQKQPGNELIAVELAAPVAETACEPKSRVDFTILLAGGHRRIESGWDFNEAGLTRLIRVVETA